MWSLRTRRLNLFVRESLHDEAGSVRGDEDFMQIQQGGTVVSDRHCLVDKFHKLSSTTPRKKVAIMSTTYSKLKERTARLS